MPSGRDGDRSSFRNKTRSSRYSSGSLSANVTGGGTELGGSETHVLGGSVDRNTSPAAANSGSRRRHTVDGNSGGGGRSSKKSKRRNQRIESGGADERNDKITSLKPLVEYSDVSSEELSSPEAGEIQSEGSGAGGVGHASGEESQMSSRRHERHRNGGKRAKGKRSRSTSNSPKHRHETKRRKRYDDVTVPTSPSSSSRRHFAAASPNENEEFGKGSRHRMPSGTSSRHKEKKVKRVEKKSSKHSPRGHKKRKRSKKHASRSGTPSDETQPTQPHTESSPPIPIPTHIINEDSSLEASPEIQCIENFGKERRLLKLVENDDERELVADIGEREPSREREFMRNPSPFEEATWSKDLQKRSTEKSKKKKKRSGKKKVRRPVTPEAKFHDGEYIVDDPMMARHRYEGWPESATPPATTLRKRVDGRESPTAGSPAPHVRSPRSDGEMLDEDDDDLRSPRVPNSPALLAIAGGGVASRRLLESPHTPPLPPKAYENLVVRSKQSDRMRSPHTPPLGHTSPTHSNKRSDSLEEGEERNPSRHSLERERLRPMNRHHLEDIEEGEPDRHRRRHSQTPPKHRRNRRRGSRSPLPLMMTRTPPSPHRLYRRDDDLEDDRLRYSSMSKLKRGRSPTPEIRISHRMGGSRRRRSPSLEHVERVEKATTPCCRLILQPLEYHN